MITQNIHIVCMGASTPLGQDAWSSAAAVRAGVAGFREHPFMFDTVGEPMKVAMAPWLAVELPIIDRLMNLLIPAIDEALEPLVAIESDMGMTFRVGLALALPPSRPGLPERFQDKIKEKLSLHFANKVEIAAIFPFGHAAGFFALNLVIDGLKNGRFDLCLVAGVDSYIAPETLEWLEDCEQLHGAGSLNNAWGFIPGEAAGALLLAQDNLLARGELDSYGRFLSVGLGTEKLLIKTEATCLGEGLTQAFHAAIAILPAEVKVQNIYCDMNGEPYRANEYGFTVLRTKEQLESATDFIAPADCWGDIGAAGMPLHTILSLVSHRKRYSNGTLSLVWSSSESGERGAGLIEFMQEGVR